MPYARWSSAILGFLRDVVRALPGAVPAIHPAARPDRPEPDRRDLRPADRRRHHRRPHPGVSARGAWTRVRRRGAHPGRRPGDEGARARPPGARRARRGDRGRARPGPRRERRRRLRRARGRGDDRRRGRRGGARGAADLLRGQRPAAAGLAADRAARGRRPGQHRRPDPPRRGHGLPQAAVVAGLQPGRHRDHRGGGRCS